MTVEVRFDRKVSGVSAAWVRKVVEKTLGKKTHEVSVLITGDKQIRRINKRYLHHDDATDVISFGAGPGPFLGDVVVSAETARSTAAELKIPFKEELARYLVHGTLHLLGYRDKRPKDRERMHKHQESILKRAL